MGGRRFSALVVVLSFVGGIVGVGAGVSSAQAAGSNLAQEVTAVTTLKIRTTRLAVAIFAAAALGPSGALADTQAVRDPNDTASRLDVKVLRHGHTPNGSLKHVIVTREGWTKSQFAREGSIRFLFSYFGDSCADAWVLIDTKNGELRARWQGYDPLGCPKGDDNGGFTNYYENVTVKKPSRDRIVLIVPRERFPKRADAYRWAVTTIWTACDPCGDDAPDRGNSDRTKIRHEL